MERMKLDGENTFHFSLLESQLFTILSPTEFLFSFKNRVIPAAVMFTQTENRIQYLPSNNKVKSIKKNEANQHFVFLSTYEVLSHLLKALIT